MDSDLHGGTRIAVLIDADNTSPKYAEALLEEVAKYGTPTIKRAYGDFSHQRLSGWTRELNARAIRSMHQIAFTTGKNSTDSALIIDAMDLLYADNVEAFAIVSSDSDFTSLALRLRESGKRVYGLGRKTTPSSLQNACDRFIALEVLMTDAADESEDTAEVSEADELAEKAEAPSFNLQSALTKAINARADDDGWVSCSVIGSHLTRTHASFDPRNFGHGKLSALVLAQPYLETRGDSNRLEARLKAARKTAAKATSRSTPKTAAKTAARAGTKKSAAAEAPTVTTTTRTRAAKSAAVDPEILVPEIVVLEAVEPEVVDAPTVKVTTRTRGSKSAASPR